jgi:hypothetical protein
MHFLLAFALCACNWQLAITGSKGAYSLQFTDPKGQQYTLENCQQLTFKTKKAATDWARDFKLNPEPHLKCLKPLQ